MSVSLDFKRGLKTLWAESAQGKMPSLEANRTFAIKNPYRNSDPLNEVLTYLALQNTGHIAPPLIPRVTPMPVAELCQLALLWACAKEKEAAAALANSIPLDFPWMWSRENEYNEEETVASISLLSRAIGKEVHSVFLGDPYFQALSQIVSAIKKFSEAETGQNSKSSMHLEIFDWSRIETENGLKCCYTFFGSRTSVGSLISNKAEIRAFGPQAFPLSDPMGFGIRSVSGHEKRWASPAALPEIWFDTKVHRVDSGLMLDLSFFGMKPGTPLAFSFYVKADSAQIGNEKFKPKTLQRYHGISKPVQFGGGLCLQSLMPGKMELIPLAGSGGYWDCEYLAAFEIHPVNAKISFLFTPENSPF